MSSQRGVQQRETTSSAPFSSTQSNSKQSNDTPTASIVPSISLPHGGGSIGGIGEKFDVSPATGTASVSFPIFCSPTRGGLHPSLTLTYNSGSGNGPFGLGWTLSPPSITRKTAKGLPRYRDSEDSDVFIFGDEEDLVPIFKRNEDGEIIVDHTNGKPLFLEEVYEGHVIRKYSPRVEGSFVRIERWTKIASPGVGHIHWRTITPENVTSIYGKDVNSRIYNPSLENDQQHTYAWLISETYDMQGNAIIYKYKSENSNRVCINEPHERNRSEQTRSSNRYLHAIKYGNKSPNRHQSSWNAFSAFDLPECTWMFTLAFDYGEYDADFPKPDDAAPWLARMDPFSSYRAGFEIRTYRLCRRILMFHHFPDEFKSNPDCLVMSTNFEYDETPSLTYLASARRVGFLQDETNNCYLSKSMPPAQFEYSRFPSDEELARLQVHEIDSTYLENLPYGVDGLNFEWVDLDGEGLSGVLSEQANGCFYKRNLSANNQIEKVDGDHTTTITMPKLGPMQNIHTIPSLSLSVDQCFFADVKGDGLMDLVRMDNLVCGFYSREYKRGEVSGWHPFRQFKSFPNINSRDPELRFVDLTGDGLPDILITEDQAFVWYPSLGADGYGEGLRTPQSLDEERGPKIIFGEQDQTIYLADMSGDGLIDLLRVRNGQVCYWPNTGYGSFGAKVTMDNSPLFTTHGDFNPRFIRIADIDGSGTNDLIYVSSAGVDIYCNHAGNGFSNRKRLSLFPPTGDLSTLSAIDLLGTGTTCLVWSSFLPNNAPTPMKYVDITNGKKPHLLVAKHNNIGITTRLHYTPSTKFYLDDREAGRPWITLLPFPVQCVERVEVFDQVSHNRFVNRYAYHHGYYDGYEREFRGFAMVEQWDTEDFGVMSTRSSFEETGCNVDATWHMPPAYTKTWFYNGAFLDQGSQSLANEYFGAPSPDISEEFKQFTSKLLNDSVIPHHLNYDERRESYRALSGHIFRQEVYAEDGSRESKLPYVITEYNYTVKVPQDLQDSHRHSVQPLETLSLNLERSVNDPRKVHKLILDVDMYGNIRKEVNVAYGRKPDKDIPVSSVKFTQERSIVEYTENDMTSKIDEQNDYLLPKLCESRSYQLYGFQADEQKGRFSLHQFTRDGFAPLREISEIAFDAEADLRMEKRLMQRSRTLFRSNDLSCLLPLGKMETMALIGESYSLAFSSSLVDKIYRRQLSGNTTENLINNPIIMFGGKDGGSGGYVDLDSDGSWWIPSGRTYFAPEVDISPQQELVSARNHFFTVFRYTDPFDNNSTCIYDVYDLQLIQTRDAMGNISQAQIDYRTLNPFLITDPNGNRTQCVFDELGFVVGTALMGKVTENVGDSLKDFQTILTQDEMDQYFNDPKGDIATKLLANATTRIIYDLSRFSRENDNGKKSPIYFSTISRETHASDTTSGKPRTQVGFSYYDGLGREIQKRLQAPPHSDVGDEKIDPIQWIASGWTIFNNKGKSVRQYEPFFDSSHDFVFGQKVGVGPFIFYDPLGRIIGTLNPDHTWTKLVFDAWHHEIYDENDTVLMDPKNDIDIGNIMQLLPQTDYLPTWFESRANGQMGREKQLAAQKAALHANTPTVTYLDPLGRVFNSAADNGEHGKYQTHVLLDIQDNQKNIIDAKGRVVLRLDHDMVGNVIHQSSMESGERWVLNDVMANPLYIWNDRASQEHYRYDVLRRRIEAHVKLEDQPSSEFLVERIVYGEARSNPERQNTRTRVIQTFDQSGIETTDYYDFKGNLLRSERQLAEEYKALLDWSGPVPLEDTVYTKTTKFDALNRPIEMTVPDNSRICQSYDESGYLNQVGCQISGDTSAMTAFVKNIQYNAKGQRTLMAFGNGVSTSYSYDPLTFDIVHMKMIRKANNFPDDCKHPPPVGWPGCQIQNIHYTYDPVRNISHIEDKAQQTIFFRNQRVDPSNEFTYDAIYRLVETTGREHISLSIPSNAHNLDTSRLEHPHDGRAMTRFNEKYSYDEVGNFMSTQHITQDSLHPGWTRKYEYNEESQVEPEKLNNRLSRTKIGSVTENYCYDGDAGRQGNITSMPNLRVMRWDYKNQLQATSQQIVKEGQPEITWYVYDASGQRIRKVTERQTAPGVQPTRLKERIYLEDYEVYRTFNGQNEVLLERNTISVMDNDRRVALIESRIKGEGTGAPKQLIRYQYVNHLNSVCLELDDHAQIISYEEYTPYGATSYRSSETAIPKRYRYTGKERDEENGLYYYGSRYYSAMMGRWVSCDPSGVEDGLNLYLYVSCNPVNLIDPDGEVKRKTPGSSPIVPITPPADTPTRIFLTVRRRIPPSTTSVSTVSTTSTLFRRPTRSTTKAASSSLSSPSSSSPATYGYLTLSASGVPSLPPLSYNFVDWIRATPGTSWFNKLQDRSKFHDNARFPWHHVFQKEYHKFFTKFGINCHELGVVIWVEDHKDVHSTRITGQTWDEHWRVFVEEKRGEWRALGKKGRRKAFFRIQDEIVQFGMDLLRKFSSRISPDSIGLGHYTGSSKSSYSSVKNALIAKFGVGSNKIRADLKGEFEKAGFTSRMGLR